MAGVPTVPPLLCNTPPPIDFGEEDDDSGLPPTLALEDDEFGDFALATDLNEDVTNADASSLPRTPLQFELSSSTTSGFTDVPPTFEDCRSVSTPPPLQAKFNDAEDEETHSKIQLHEACNFNVKKHDIAESEDSQSTQNAEDDINNRVDAVEAPINIAQNDNKQLTIDSKDAKNPNSNCTVQAEIRTTVAKENENVCNLARAKKTDGNINNVFHVAKSPPLLTANVLLEDLADDSSDEECHRSPKKTLSSSTSPLTYKDDFDDFFAIRVVDASSSSPEEDKPMSVLEDINMNKFSNHNNNIINNRPDANFNGTEEHDDDFDDFADFESASEYIKPAGTVDFVDAAVGHETAADEPHPDNGALYNDDEDDFDDFQDFCTALSAEPTAAPIISTQNALDRTAENNVNSTESTERHKVVEESLKSGEKAEENDDEDDFGDFEAASFDTPLAEVAPTTPTSSSHVPAIASGNISERLGFVLKQMFPTTNNNVAGDDIVNGKETKVVKTLPSLQSADTTLPFESIEAAKALEFQWPQSEMRHALIRSIGIDSRNILFGENWNPSMPRFAANLSFNPLKPMKPQTANMPTSISSGTTFSDADSMHYGTSSPTCAADMDINSYAMKTDVPDVEFDWQGAGLVNPLDASHVHTLLLDLDQVMVMATKFDNSNVDSSSFSACATLEQLTTTTTTTTATAIITANNKLINQIKCFNVIPYNTQTTAITTTTTTPTLIATNQSTLSSSKSSSSPLLLIYNNSNLPTSHQRTNTLKNICTAYQNCNSTTTRTFIGGLYASHTSNAFDSLNNSLNARRPIGNRTTNNIESLMYLNNFTNHIAEINENHTPPANTINNKNSYDENSNSTDRFTMSSTLKIDQTANFISPSPFKFDAFYNDNKNVLNKPMETANFHLIYNRLRECSRIKGETNTRETETIHPAPPIARFDTPDDQHKSHTTFTNISDSVSETLSNNNIEVMLSPPRDIPQMPIPLDMDAQKTCSTQDESITSNSSCNSNSCSSGITNSKTYDNSTILTTLRLGANIINNEHGGDVVDDDDDDDDETVVTSTYAGPLKETHIYTPSKTEITTTMKTSKSAVSNSEPIDFDYEIAAAGIIIDEKVVKKEYRDVEYNPGFSLEVVNEYGEELTSGTPTILTGEPGSKSVLPSLGQAQAQPLPVEFDNDEFTEFTEFQSVPPPQVTSLSTAAAARFPATNSPITITSAAYREEINSKTINNSTQPVLPAAVAKTKESSNTPSRTNSPSVVDNMILSPAILLPQAIPIGNNNTNSKKSTAPAIEWGDSTANIDPDELARIEELFPQPKMASANSTQKSSPTHTYAEKSTSQIATTTISATVAMKEQDSTLNDDYWSEFVSVPAKPQMSSHVNRLNNNSGINHNNNNNNQLVITPKRNANVHANNSNNTLRSPRQQQQFNVQRRLTPTPQQMLNASNAVTSSTINVYNNSSNSNSNSNDDDWSDFVSSTPAPPAPPVAPAASTSFKPATHMPQFNSAAWQNANFYNNPLGLYHQHTNMHTRTAPLLTPQQQQLQLQQQIHVMQDFSTAATITARPHATLLNTSNTAHINNMQHSNSSYSPLQVGNARVAPSISLIPDLGFVAPAMPVHTAFVNVLPKTSFNNKK